MTAVSGTFADRADAGRRLGEWLTGYARVEPVIVALPRGGVPVAAEVARRLDAPLDVLLVRKVGYPWHAELGVGAIAEGGFRILNKRLLGEFGLDEADLASILEREQAELERRTALYRGAEPPLPVAGRTVILVDDGLATGYTARAAIAALRDRGAGRIVLAAPVAPPATIAEMRGLADEVVAILTPDWLGSIGQFYDDFRQTTDEEVLAALAEGRAREARGRTAVSATPA